MDVRELRKIVFLSKILIVILIFSSLFLSTNALAARKISFQTKIIKPDGNNLEASAVNFKFSLTDPSGTCVIYSEIFSNVDMSNSSGSLTLLLGDGSRSYPTTGGVTWTSAFDNKTTSYNCAPPSSTTYSPSVGDSRKLYVQFNDGSLAGSQLLPAMEVSAVPYAMYADNATTLGSYASTDFILKANATTCTGGQVSSYDGTTFNCVAGGAGSGGASGYNFVNTTSNAATNITAQPNGTATSSGLAVYNSSSGVNNAYGSILAGASAVDIRSGVNGTGTQLPLTFTVGASEAMRFDTSGNMGIGTNAPSSKLDVSGALTMRGMAAPSLSGAGQGRIYFDSVANKFKVSENGGAYVDLLGAGTSGFVNDGNSFGAAATIGTNDNFALNFETNNTTRMTIDNTGNVGIGTSTPGSALDVKGTLRLSGSTSGYVGFAPAAAAGSTTYTLPAADGTASQVLTTNGSGVLSWSTPAGSITSVGGTAPISSSGGATPTISMTQSNTTTDGYLSSTDWNTFNNKLGTATSFSGDMSGAYNSTSVDKIKGKAVSPAAYSTGQVLRYNGTDWVNTTLGFSDLSGKPTTLAGYGITDAQSSTLASGKLLVGNGSNVATAVSMSGDATMDNAGAVTLATVPVSKGGTNVTSFTANKIVGTNGTGTALTSFSCALNEVISFDVTGAAVCNSIGSVSGSFVNNGNSYGANATLGTNDNFALNFETNNTTRMTIDNTGNVGVGTTSPTSSLDVVGYGTGKVLSLTVRSNPNGAGGGIFYNSIVFDNLYGPGNFKNQFSLRSAGDEKWAIGNDMMAVGAQDFYIWDGVALATRLYISPSGYLGLGTTSPAFTLEVNGTIAPTGNGATDLGASGNKFRDVYATNGTINTSDFRQKRNIQSSDLGLSFINELRPVSYNWKDGDSHLHYGVIAQETKNALQEAKKLSGRLDEVDNVIVTHDEATDAYGVRYTELISPIIKAIQELYSQLIGVNAKVSKLEIENAKLKKENEAIKDRLDKIEKALLNNKK